MADWHPLDDIPCPHCGEANDAVEDCLYFDQWSTVECWSCAQPFDVFPRMECRVEKKRPAEVPNG